MMRIRAYRPDDRTAVERINYETGLLGSSLAATGVSRQLIAGGIAGYFDDFSDFIFVAETETGEVAGYVLGEPPGPAGRSEKMRVLGRIAVNMCRLPLASPGDRRHIANQLRVTVKAGLGLAEEGRFKVPPGAGHLHINLLPGNRGRGTGSALLDAFTARLRQEGVGTVYAASYLTGRNPNRQFWAANGFNEYSKIKSSVWERMFPGEDIYLVCYAKETA